MYLRFDDWFICKLLEYKKIYEICDFLRIFQIEIVSFFLELIYKNFQTILYRVWYFPQIDI